MANRGSPKDCSTFPPHYPVRTVSIQNRLILLILVAFVPVLLVEAAIYYERFQTRRSEALNTTLEFARATAMAFDQLIQDILQEELNVGTAISFLQSPSEQEVHRLLETIPSRYKAVSEIAWITPGSPIICSGEIEKSSLALLDSTFSQEITAGQDWAVSDLFLNPINSVPSFWISHGIRDDRGVLSGKVFALLVPHELTSLLPFAQLGECTVDVMDRKGQSVTVSDSRGSSGESPPIKKGPNIVQSLVTSSGNNTSSSDGRKMWVSAFSAGTTGWEIIVERPERELTDSVMSRLSLQAGIFLLSMMMAVSSALVVARRIARPLKALNDHVLHFQNSKYRVERGLTDTGGIKELADLANSFDAMTWKILEREKELLRVQERLEERVLERTADLESTMNILKAEIDERAETEQLLRQSKELFQKTFNTHLDAIFILDHQVPARIIHCNPAARSMFGYSLDEMVGRTIGFLHNGRADLRDFQRRLLQAVEQHGYLHLSLFRLKRKDGTVFPTEHSVMPLLDETGKRIGWVSAVRDVTERIEAQRKLQESEKKYRNIVETAQEGIWMIDREAKITFANRKMATMLGYTIEQMLGRPLFSFMVDSTRSDAEEYFHNRTQRINEQQDFCFRRKDGSKLWTIINTTALLDEGGEFLGELGMIIDISHRKESEEALRKSEDKLRHLSSRLLTSQEEERKRIARELHDSVGSSLTAMKIFLENALRQTTAGTPSHDALQYIITITQTIISESRRIMMDLRPSSLDDFGIVKTIGWFCSDFEFGYPAIEVDRKITAKEHDIPNTLKVVVFRIVQEAFQNIAKHSNASLVGLTLTRSETSIDLIIEDNGIGFDLEAYSSEKNERRGLGIISMKERAELSGGTFIIDSIRGNGTKILVRWAYEAIDAAQRSEC